MVYRAAAAAVRVGRAARHSCSSSQGTREGLCGQGGAGAMLHAAVGQSNRLFSSTGAAAAPAGKVTMDVIKELRGASGAPITDCKKALTGIWAAIPAKGVLHKAQQQESISLLKLSYAPGALGKAEGVDGDIAKAFEWLRKRGISKASSMADRSANEGLIGVWCSEEEGQDGEEKRRGGKGVIVEVGSETDFVARNERFQAFLRDVLRTVERSGADSGPVDVTALLQEKVARQEGGAGAVGDAGVTVGDALADLVGVIRENITVKRAGVLRVEQGVVSSYVHGAAGIGMGKSAALVALRSSLPLQDSSSSSSSSSLSHVGKALAMHVVAAKPSFLSPATVPQAALEREKAIFTEQALGSGKPANVVEKMVNGRVAKYLSEHTLLEQGHMIEEGNPKVGKYIAAYGQQEDGSGGGGVEVDDFLLYAVGGGK